MLSSFNYLLIHLSLLHGLAAPIFCNTLLFCIINKRKSINFTNMTINPSKQVFFFSHTLSRTALPRTLYSLFTVDFYSFYKHVCLKHLHSNMLGLDLYYELVKCDTHLWCHILSSGRIFP